MEIPDELQHVYRRAVRLEWLTLVYLISAVLAIYFTLGSSQAMKGAWLEDTARRSLPSIAFLVAARIRYRRPNKGFPYGYHRAVEVAFLASALALLLTGVYLIVDSVLEAARGRARRRSGWSSSSTGRCGSAG